MSVETSPVRDLQLDLEPCRQPVNFHYHFVIFWQRVIKLLWMFYNLFVEISHGLMTLEVYVFCRTLCII